VGLAGGEWPVRRERCGESPGLGRPLGVDLAGWNGRAAVPGRVVSRSGVVV